MPNYKKMYYLLSANVSDAIERLMVTQRECENIIMDKGLNIGDLNSMLDDLESDGIEDD